MHNRRRRRSGQKLWANRSVAHVNNAFCRYAVLGEGPLTSSIGLETVAFITTKYGNQSDDWPDIEFMLTSTSTNSDGGTAGKKAHCLRDDFYDELLGDLNNKDVFGVFPMLLRPKSRGHILLRSSNPHHYPKIYHNYFSHPDDIRVLREGVKAAVAVGETTAMKRFGARFHARPVPGCKDRELFTDEYWECVIRQYTMTIYHMSGKNQRRSLSVRSTDTSGLIPCPVFTCYVCLRASDIFHPEPPVLAT